MKQKITIGIIAFLCIAIIGIGAIYISSTNPLKKDEEKAISKAKMEAGLSEVTSIDWFHYTESYYVIEGKDRNGKDVFIWVPDDGKKDIVVKEVTDGITKKEVIDLVYNGLEEFSADKRPKEIIRVKLGMVENVPAYEVTYRDKKDRYSILFVDFYDGQWYRVYNL